MSLTLASDSSWLTVTKDWDKLPELVAIWTAADGAGHCYCSEPSAASSAVDRYGMCAKRMKVCDWNSTEAVAMRAGFGVRKSLSRWALGYRVPQDTLSLHRSMQMSLPFSSHLFTFNEKRLSHSKSKESKESKELSRCHHQFFDAARESGRLVSRPSNSRNANHFHGQIILRAGEWNVNLQLHRSA